MAPNSSQRTGAGKPESPANRHFKWRRWESNPREVPANDRLRRWLAAAVLVLAFMACFLGPLFAVQAFASCHTHRCFQRWLKEHRPWVYAWRHLSYRERSWARCIASYETRGYPWSVKARVVGTWGHLGAMQFSPSTAVAAGFKRRVTQTTLHEQLVRGVWWMHRAGKSQWSTSRYCG